MQDYLCLKVASSIEDRIKEYYHRDEFDTTRHIGEIIGIQRNKYYHYGIYVGNGKVVHYTSESDDISDDNKIMETTLEKFFRETDTLFVVKVNEIPSLFDRIRGELISKFSNVETAKNPQVFTPEETIQRAYQRLDEKEYDLKFNNCEHFAYWAKMGLPISDQVKNVLATLGLGVAIAGVVYMIINLLQKK